MENKEKYLTEYSKTYIKQSYEKNWNFENIKLTQEEQNGKFTEGYIFYELWTNPKKSVLTSVTKFSFLSYSIEDNKPVKIYTLGP